MIKEKSLTKMSDTMDKLVKKALYQKFLEASEKIKEALLDKYDAELLDTVTDRNSKTNPNLYRDDFIQRLNAFSYVSGSGDSLSIKVPDMETFDFSGRMRVIQTIMEGVVGIFVEMTAKEYKDVFNHPPLLQDSLDDTASTSEIIYLVKDSQIVRKYEKEHKKKFVPYRFSNTPPIDILDEGSKFVDANINTWISEALEEAQKEFVKNYKGAKI